MLLVPKDTCSLWGGAPGALRRLAQKHSRSVSLRESLGNHPQCGLRGALLSLTQWRRLRLWLRPRTVSNCPPARHVGTESTGVWVCRIAQG